MKGFCGTLIAFFLLFALFFYLGFGIKSGKVAPGHAYVFVDIKNGTYIAPPCVKETMFASYQRTTIKAAREKKLRADNDCKNAGGFVQEGRSLSAKLIERLGFIEPIKSRWNADGSWNW